MLYEEEKPTADKYSRRLFTEYYVDIGKRSNMFLTSVTWRFKNRAKQNEIHQTLIDDMWAPVFIEISYGQAVMQVPSLLGL